MKSLFTGLLLVIAMLTSINAKAIIVPFDFRTPGVTENLGHSTSFTVSGLTIDFYAYSYLNSIEGWLEADIVQSEYGLGVDSGSLSSSDSQPSFIDSGERFDLFAFYIPFQTNPFSLTYTFLNSPTLKISRSPTFNLFSNPTELLNTGSVGTREETRWFYLMPPTLSGTDIYTLASMLPDIVGTMDPVDVPTPTTLSLFMLGFGLLLSKKARTLRLLQTR